VRPWSVPPVGTGAGPLCPSTLGAQDRKQSANKQVQNFRKAARELGCDESEERFQEALRTIVKETTK
jgi:hypothetical protein